ncbi:MAG: SOS response-associated peptidase [Acidimicrobiia bacterium]
MTSAGWEASDGDCFPSGRRTAAGSTSTPALRPSLPSPAFRDAFRRRRCLIPADGFYEWQERPEGKLPHYIRLQSGEPMGFAGIWSRWRDPASGERLTTCAIVTGRPNEVVEALHNRMPVVLERSQWEAWLETDGVEPDALLAMLTPAPAEAMIAHPVSSLVNSVDNNLPELISPLQERGSV